MNTQPARRTPRALLMLLSAALMIASACKSRDTGVRNEADANDASIAVRTSTLEAGPSTSARHVVNPYEDVVEEIAEGRRLYNWMNCAGCHGPEGGGGIGPPLADTDWIYGGESVHIYQAIMQGRPNGMPSFHGKVTEASAWRIAAFVRSLSADAASRDAENSSQRGPTDQSADEGVRR